MKRFEIMEGPLEGTHLLEASAGTGKTYTIADLYLRLIMEKGLTVDRILVVTFTVAATGELKERLRLKLKNAVMALGSGTVPPEDIIPRELYEKYRDDGGVLMQLRRALNFFDAAAVYTIHGFCQRVLLENAFESGQIFDTDLVSDQSSLLEEVVEDFWRTRFFEGHPAVYRFGSDLLLPQKLASVAKTCIDDPMIRVIPPPPDSDIEALENRIGSFYALFKEVIDLWNERKSEINGIIATMVDAGILKGTSYKRSDIAKRVSAMDSFMEKGDPKGKCDQLKFYTRSKLMRETRDPEEVTHHRFFELCENLSQLRSELPGVFNDYLIGVKHDLLSFTLEKIAERKRLKNIRSFGDLLMDLHRALHGPGGDALAAAVRSKFPAALIDEFQDTDTLQYEIFMKLFNTPGGLLYLIGDPKQAIYRFRGADIFAYMAAARGSGSRSTLGRNWRSVPGLVQSVNAIFGREKHPFVFDEDLIGFPEVEPAPREVPAFRCAELDNAPLQLWYLPPSLAGREKGRITVGQAEPLIAAAVAGEISLLVSLGRNGNALIGDRPLVPGDIAVLVRKKYQAEMVRDELLRLGVPGVLYGNESVFSSKQAEELQRIMTAVAAGGKGSTLPSALGTGIMGWTSGKLYRLKEDDALLEETAARFAGYRERWGDGGFMFMFRGLLSDENVYGTLLGRPGGERAVTNLLHLAELLHRQEAAEGTGMESLINWLADRRDNAGGRGEEEELRLETDEDAVRLVTLHRSKGLQYPVVFCPYLWGGARADEEEFTFHDTPDDRGLPSRLTLDIGSAEIDEHRRKALLEDLAESVRLMYVGLTRAQSRCYMAWGCINKTELSAPAYAFHRPPGMREPDITGMLAEHMKKISDARMRADLTAFERTAGGHMKVTDIPLSVKPVFAPPPAPSGEPSCRKFAGEIRREWMISSYSSLVAGASYAEEVHDTDVVEHDLPPYPERNQMTGMYAFPAGTTSGVLIHEIFEKLDFTANDDGITALVREKLEKYGFDDEWTDTVVSMVRRVLSTPLDRGTGSVLKSLGPGDRLNELEFYFPLKKPIDPEGLGDVFGRFGVSAENTTGDIMERLDFTSRRGYMRGFIDMVFRRDGRFYLLDWKSNLLGTTPGNYDTENLRRTMKQHHYDLQYHLYAVALHRYLKTRCAGYNYEKHFGGVYYLFIRGIGAGDNENSGVFFDRPSAELIESLSSYLCGEGN